MVSTDSSCVPPSFHARMKICCYCATHWPGSLGPHASCSHVGTGHRPRPHQLLSRTLQIRTSSPHGPFAARDQATSAEYQFGSGSSQLGRGNAPSPHVSRMRAVPEILANELRNGSKFWQWLILGCPIRWSTHCRRFGVRRQRRRFGSLRN